MKTITPAARLAAAVLACSMAAAPAVAQTEVQMHAAELAVPFGVVAGQLILVSDQLVFINTATPAESFAIDRANVRDAGREDTVVTLSLREPVLNLPELRFRLDAPTEVVDWAGRVGAGAEPTRMASSSGDTSGTTYQVKHDHMMLRGSCIGQLTIMDDRLAFESVGEINHSRQWFFAYIKEIKQDGIYKLEVSPFLGNGYDFELVGQGLNSQEFRELVDKIAAARTR